MQRLILVALFAGACAGAQKGAPAEAPDPHLIPDIADDASLTKEQCIEMIDHAFEVYVRGNPSAEDLARAEQEREAQKSEDSVNQCVKEVNGKFYKCVLTAQTREAVDACSPPGAQQPPQTPGQPQPSPPPQPAPQPAPLPK